MGADEKIEKILDYYMGKNTPDRQEFIINNLKIEREAIDTPEEEAIFLSDLKEKVLEDELA
jgi:topoisomerase IV subunit B